jgi:hypothetical protein
MYVMGGKAGMNSATMASVLKHDSTQDAWREVAPIPTARFGFAACVVGCIIYVFGDSETGNLVPVFNFDTEVEEWDTLPPMPIV